MESGISTFDGWLESVGRMAAGRDLHAALEVISSQARQAFGARIWFAQVLGRRWSYIAGLRSQRPACYEAQKVPLAAGVGLVAESWSKLPLEQQARLRAFLERLVVSSEHFWDGSDVMRRTEIIDWFREERPEELSRLFKTANRVRRENVGSDVHLRGLIEFSNNCRRNCSYCGIRAPNRKVARYRMCADEILDCVGAAVRLGYGTVVLQSAEDPELDAEWMADLIRRVKTQTEMSVTLSLGERTEAELALWRWAGADRYLLRFETSNQNLYRRFHPSLPGSDSDRLGLLVVLRSLGYETGSGILVGLPGQTFEDLARDISLFCELDLDMIGVGPYIPHPDTPLGRSWKEHCAPVECQVPNTEYMAYKVLALTRLVCPQANIPATTAVAVLNRCAGFELGLSRGANVIMPNLTPMHYRKMYDIYPGKSCVFDEPDSAFARLRYRILNQGRGVGRGRGDSPNYTRRIEKETARKVIG